MHSSLRNISCKKGMIKYIKKGENKMVSCHVELDSFPNYSELNHDNRKHAELYRDIKNTRL